MPRHQSSAVIPSRTGTLFRMSSVLSFATSIISWTVELVQFTELHLTVVRKPRPPLALAAPGRDGIFNSVPRACILPDLPRRATASPACITHPSLNPAAALALRPGCGRSYHFLICVTRFYAPTRTVPEPPLANNSNPAAASLLAASSMAILFFLAAPLRSTKRFAGPSSTNSMLWIMYDIPSCFFFHSRDA
ncbi:hypothetical protein CERZMDRAFT_90250, partial [Cercospora zeae-maydis SCOH1-5]